MKNQKKSRLAKPQFNLDLNDELVVDNFAGGGGASSGIELGIGRPVDIAINHDEEAIAMHQVNHPHTNHYCENVWDVDPREVTKGRPVGLAWFSPDCKHFSKAKGGTPVEKNIRGLAWVVVKWAAAVRPRVIMLENVPEFVTWGPLTDENKPCPIRKGETFDNWKGQLEGLGYKIEHKELRACDYGAPTIRKRFFLIARCDGKPIVWPKPTHGPGLEPYHTAAEIIDWTLPTPSIFGRKKMLVKNTLRRMVKGVERFVLNEPNPFIISYYGPKKPGGDFRGIQLNQPLPTQTTENRFGLISPFIARIGHTKWGGDGMQYPVSDPLTTITSKAEHLLVAPFIVKHFGGMVGSSIDTPIPTITARGTQNQLATSHLLKLRNNQFGQDVREPIPTLTAGGGHIGEVRAFLVKYYGTAIGQSISDPLHSVTSKARFGFVSAECFDPPLTDDQRYSSWCVARLMEEHGDICKESRSSIPGPRPSAIGVGDSIIVDIGMRMLSPKELFHGQGFSDDYIHEFEYKGKPLTKTAQVRMCGNSVPPNLAEALVNSNFKKDQAQEDVA